MPSYVDLTGKRFGKWSVIRRSTSRQDKYDIFWVCKCDCGKERDVRQSSLLKGRSKSCGCSRHGVFKSKISRSDKDAEMIGKRFGRWVIESRAQDYIIQVGRYDQWNCVCDCGTKGIVLGSNLLSGKSKSCGCLKSELQQKRCLEQKAYVKYKSLNPQPTKEEMLKVILGDEYDSLPTEEQIDQILRNVFNSFWVKNVRAEQGVIRRYKREHPFCDICGKECETEVHHVRPVAEYGGNEPENIQWLCHDCHRKLENERLKK